MTNLSKILLSVAVPGLTLGSVIAYHGDIPSPALTVVLPLGAISFGLFLIVFALEREVAVDDLEKAEKKPAPQCNTAAAPNKKEFCPHPTTVQKKSL